VKRFRLFWRLIQINWVLAKHGLEKIVLSLHLFRPLFFLTYLNPWNWFRRSKWTRGDAIRQSLIELGPIYVKFGQMLSTRRDLIPTDVATSLALLQDKVPPFPSKVAVDIIEKAFDKPIKEIFSHFDETPLASASIAQVHAATLPDGTDVIVKVLRPRVHRHIKQDLEVLYTLAELAETYWHDGKRLRPTAIVKEFDRTLHEEINLLREAGNASQLRRNFADSEYLHIPTIHWQYARENVIVMERIYGMPVTNIEALIEHGVNVKRLAERGVELFFTQVFRDSFFHADMHPGNIFVSFEKPEDPRLICVDFGIIGALSPSDQRYIAENFLAFFNRDYRRVAELHVESGWVGADTRIEDFEGAIRAVCEPMFERPLSEVSIGRMFMFLFQTGRQFDMEVQPQLVMLQKTLLAVEGLGKALHPDLDLWKTAKPFLEKCLQEQIGPAAVLRKFRDETPGLIEKMPEIPRMLHSILSQVQHDQHTRRVHEQRARLKPANGKSFLTVTRTAGLGLVATSGLAYLWQAGLIAPSVPQLAAVGGVVGILMVLFGKR